MMQPLRIDRIYNTRQFEALHPRLEELLSAHQRLLTDDFVPSLDTLARNLATTVPFLWVGRDVDNRLWTGASLNDVIPGRHAFLHGISHPQIRRHPAVTLTAMAALETAFEELAVMKVKAEFDADNRGARGFCLRFGFTKEAHFKDDTRVGGRPKDVVVWSLFAHTYYAQTRRKMQHVLWQERKQE